MFINRGTLNTALSMTVHCLTGCAIGEVAGVAIGTALGWSDMATILLAIGLAFIFGYSLTMRPLLSAGISLRAAVAAAVAADTLSITVMEIVDNGIILAIPGAMEAGLGEALFWGSLAFALAVAFSATLPVNYVLIARGLVNADAHRRHADAGPHAPQALPTGRPADSTVHAGHAAMLHSAEPCE